ncbi:MAG: DUF1365 domain-containing protein [Solirubrobacterales bacterium]
MTASAIYQGWVRHRRFEPVEHEFRYRLFLIYLDLDELPTVLDPFPLCSARRPAPARFRRADFMGDPRRPLAECARDAVEAQSGRRPEGPVRLLANLRYLGHAFNPVAFYYCFGTAADRVENVVADVNNIPWGERHPYVLARESPKGAVLAGELNKMLHVSPLMGMEQRYAFRATEPGATLSVHIESRPLKGGAKAFDATLSLRRRELSARRLAATLARYPAMSAQVVAKIYLQTLRLRLKGARYFPHPEGKRPKGFISP